MPRGLLGRSLEILLANYYGRGDNGRERVAADLARKYVGGHHEKPQWMQIVVSALPQCTLLRPLNVVNVVLDG